MKTIKKLFLLTVLGIGVYVNVNADNIQAQIRAKINEHKQEIANITNSIQLNNFLARLKNAALAILNDAGELSPRNQALKEALESLNPADKFSIAANIKPILANLDADISATIKNAIPPVYKTILQL
jgi:hypothetical protein